jgi:hypothetical protein
VDDIRAARGAAERLRNGRRAARVQSRLVEEEVEMAVLAVMALAGRVGVVKPARP